MKHLTFIFYCVPLSLPPKSSTHPRSTLFMNYCKMLVLLLILITRRDLYIYVHEIS